MGTYVIQSSVNAFTGVGVGDPGEDRGPLETIGSEQIEDNIGFLHIDELR